MDVSSRKSENGFTITTLALTDSLSGSLGNGQPGMPSTTRKKWRSWSLPKGYPAVLQDLRHSWEPSRMPQPVYGRNYPVKNRSHTRKWQRSGRKIDLQGISKP